MSEEKKVIVLLKKPPHGSLFPVEGLRMAVALSGDLEPLTVATNDAVYTFLKSSDISMAEHHIQFLTDIDLGIIIDKKSIDERGISETDLIEAITVKDHDEVLKLISECDLVIPF
jgi:tRNA 2-thiouridine synthesizing protein C